MDDHREPNLPEGFPELSNIGGIFREPGEQLAPEQKAESDAAWLEVFEMVRAIKNGTYKRKTEFNNDTKK